MKKRIAMLMALLIGLTAFAMPAFAYEVGEKRLTMGADLTVEQKAQIYTDFGITAGNIPELTVTNGDERAYLNGLVPDGKIGSVALSCIYIEILEPNSGLNITTNNINWCTADMYRNALTTAGITNAKVMVSAPFPVSGTAALTGTYKAYEDITGVTLTEIAKAAGVEELVVTGELAEYIGSEEATVLINELKKILDQTQNMTDDEVRAEIRSLAKTYNVALTDAQVEQLLKLCRSLEKLDVPALKERILGIANTLESAKKAQTSLSNFATGVKNFFSSIGGFFQKLFGGKSGNS